MLTEKQTNDILNKMQDFDTYDSNKAWNKLHKQIAAEAEKVRILRIRTIFAAASIVLFIGIFTGIFYLKTSGNIYENNTNMPLAVILPDSSNVYLNVNSKIILDKNFGKKRRNLKLMGTAFFEVTHNKQNPFTVNTGNNFIEVTGTTFSITANTENNETEVFVKTGSVKVYNTKQSVSVKSGYIAKVLQDKSLYVKLNNNVNYLSWKTRKLVFEATPLKKAINDISKVYNCKIDTKNIDTENIVITATFDKISIDQVITGVCLALNLHFTKKDNIYILQN
jgi:ferric-dicitrate binding protein FerR (iron transport regulator)